MAKMWITNTPYGVAEVTQTATCESNQQAQTEAGAKGSLDISSLANAQYRAYFQPLSATQVAAAQQQWNNIANSKIANAWTNFPEHKVVYRLRRELLKWWIDTATVWEYPNSKFHENMWVPDISFWSRRKAVATAVELKLLGHDVEGL
jgi:hypothetical protein